jgi:hypothetical protein
MGSLSRPRERREHEPPCHASHYGRSRRRAAQVRALAANPSARQSLWPRRRPEPSLYRRRFVEPYCLFPLGAGRTMPLKLVPPNPARRSPNYRVRGTYLGVSVNRSTETSDKRKAQAFLARIRDAIERGAFSAKPPLSFAEAATSYMQAGGEKRFIAPLLRHFKEKAIETIIQADIDGGATAVYPKATSATRNRQFYTPLMAILHHAGVETKFRRPKDATGTPRTVFLKPDEFEALSKAAKSHDREFGVAKHKKSPRPKPRAKSADHGPVPKSDRARCSDSRRPASQAPAGSSPANARKHGNARCVSAGPQSRPRPWR